MAQRSRQAWSRRQATSLLVRATCVALFPLAACAAAVPPSPAGRATPLQAPQPSAADLAEVDRLRAALAREVPDSARATGGAGVDWIGATQQALRTAGISIDRPQVLFVADRNPKVQELRLVAAFPDPIPWQIIGGSKISTGQMNRKLYYITPTGVFVHSANILGYRAEGTYNENHIRGLGAKGMRVWDFGWHLAEKGWRDDREQGEIRLLIHATDPDYLEQRLGRPASQGCVRVSARMNKFLDRHGLLDAEYEQAAVSDIRYATLLLPDRTPSPMAGTTMVVIDSAVPLPVDATAAHR